MTLRIESSEDAETTDDAIAIRRDVFIREQGVPEAVEMDDKDDESIHYVAYDEGVPVGTTRVRQIDEIWGRIERVAVRPGYRGEGLGRRLVRRAEDRARDFGVEGIFIHAQTRVEGFYGELGYERAGEPYEKGGIELVKLEKRWS